MVVPPLFDETVVLIPDVKKDCKIISWSYENKNFCVKAFRFRLTANGKIQLTFDEMSPRVLKSWDTGDLCRARKLVIFTRAGKNS